MAKATATESKAARSTAASSKNRESEAVEARSATRTYVLDTSVLLSDPKALFRFKEQSVVIPIIVINELEKRSATSLVKLCATLMTCATSTSVWTFQLRSARVEPCASN